MRKQTGQKVQRKTEERCLGHVITMEYVLYAGHPESEQGRYCVLSMRH
jgi:hypothetical protein